MSILSALGVVSRLAQCPGQRTFTFTFEGQPTDTTSAVGIYYYAGMQFRATPLRQVLLSDGGSTGYPDNGTGFL
jgi:hypothetical protein